MLTRFHDQFVFLGGFTCVRKGKYNIISLFFSGSQEKQIIRNAFKSWIDNTCITFEEVDTNTDVTENHILLTAEGTGFVSIKVLVARVATHSSFQKRYLHIC